MERRVGLQSVRGRDLIVLRQERAALRGRRLGDTEIISALRRGPPAVFGVPVLAPGQLLENWIHHEDIRRAGGSVPRASQADVEAIGDPGALKRLSEITLTV